VLYSVLTCYEDLDDKKVDGVCVCCVNGTSPAKEMIHTWKDVPCISHHAILIM